MRICRNIHFIINPEEHKVLLSPSKILITFAWKGLAKSVKKEAIFICGKIQIQSLEHKILSNAINVIKRCVYLARRKTARHCYEKKI